MLNTSDILTLNQQKVTKTNNGFSVIPGATDHGYITENIDIFDFELTPEEMEHIHALNKEKRFFNVSLEDKQRILPNMQIPD